MDNSQFNVAETVQRLAASLEDLESAVGLVAPRWRGQQSPSAANAAGEAAWGVTTNLAHMAVYEELLAAPVLESLAAGRDGSDAVPSGEEDWFLHETDILSKLPMAEILRRLRRARERQIATVQCFSEEAFNEPRTQLWGTCWGGRQSAGWVAAKTVQHTWDHGNTVFQIALFAPR